MKLRLDWDLGTNSGWGLLGLNLFARLSLDSRFEVSTGNQITYEHINGIDPLLLHELFPAIQKSNENLSAFNHLFRNEKQTVIHAVGNSLKKSNDKKVNPIDLNIARIIFENTSIHNSKIFQDFDQILTASTWNRDLLSSITSKPVKMIHEGIDETLFSPGNKSGMLPDNRFYIFSGGKIEFRKGQDLVLKVFKRFSEKYDNAYLVVSWQSLWPQVSVGLKGVLDHSIKLSSNNMLNIDLWCHENGINPKKVIDLGFIPNQILPRILREMDAGLQISRAEACTNLPLKELMACGIPCIASKNTGVIDLVNEDNGIPITTQKSIIVPGIGTEGWGEVDLEDVFVMLEKLYLDRSFAKNLGNKAAYWIRENNRTWKSHVDQLKNWLIEINA